MGDLGRQILEKYKETLKDIDGIEFMSEATYGRSNRWITVILITPHKFGVDRETVRLALEAENIEAKPVWKPMHLQAVFDCGSRFKVQGSRIMQEKATTKTQNSKLKTQNYPIRVIGGSVAEDLFKRGLCLPSGTAMTDEDIGRVVSVILSCRV